MGCSKGLSTDEPVVSHSVIGGIPIYSGRHTQSDENTEVAATIPRSITPAAAHLVDRTRRHIALRLLPFLFILYITNYLDRTSVAYAAIGMSRDLGFSDRVFGLGAGIFFVSYVALQVPGALLVECWSARRMISATMITWGSLTALTGLVHTPTQLYLARFMLGAAEAGFFPGVIVYLSHWFIHDDRAKATSNFMAAIPISFVIGSPIAGWILGYSWFAIKGWRWLFILEGMPAILLGIVAFFYLTDFPGEATWLAAEQRQWIKGKLGEEKSVTAQAMSIRLALRSRTIWLLASVCFRALQLLFLVPDYAETPVRIFGRECRPARRSAILGGFRRDAGQWMAFRQEPRKILALRGAVSYRGSRTSGAHHSPPIHSVLTPVVHDGGYVHCLPSGLLGDPDRNPGPVGGSGSSGNDQCSGQRCGLCRTLPVRLPEHSNRITFLRTGRDDGLFTCRRAADAVHSKERANACQLNLPLGEAQRGLDSPLRQTKPFMENARANFQHDSGRIVGKREVRAEQRVVQEG